MVRKLKGTGPISTALNEHEDRLNRIDPGGADSRARYTSGPRGTVIESRSSARVRRSAITSTVPRWG